MQNCTLKSIIITIEINKIVPKLLKKAGLADSESIVTGGYYVICIEINICSQKSSVSSLDKMGLFNLTIYFFVLSMQVFALSALYDYFYTSKYKNTS